MSNANTVSPVFTSEAASAMRAALGSKSSRPASNWAQIASAVFAGFAVLGLAITCIKFFQEQQAEEQRRGERAEAQAREQKLETDRQTERAIVHLYTLENGLSLHLSNHPDMHLCLEDDPDGALWHNQTAKERLRFRAICAMVADELEYYLLIRDTILTHPRGADIASAWDNNLKGYCRNSYGFRAYIRSNPDVWTRMLLSNFTEHTKDLPLPDKDELKKTLVLLKKK